MAKGEARQDAFRIWLTSDGKKPLKEIAEELGVQPNKVRKWKSLDKWSVSEEKVERKESGAQEKVLERNLKRRVPPELRKTKGPPYGSQNAKGNRGGKGGPVGNRNAAGHGAPKGSQNALKTGEYATIWVDTLSPKERQILKMAPPDTLTQIEDNIKLLMIRQRRMLENIDNLKATKVLAEYEDYIVPDKSGKQSQGFLKSRKRYTKLHIDKIIAAEDALTRVQEKLTKAIEAKQRIVKDMKEEQAGHLEDDIVLIKLPEKEPKI